MIVFKSVFMPLFFATLISIFIRTFPNYMINILFYTTTILGWIFIELQY